MPNIISIRPKLIIRNISNKDVRILDKCTIGPRDQFDVFDITEPTELFDFTVFKALERPWGDLYIEIFVKRTIEIVEIDLLSFYYSKISSSNLVASNTASNGQVLSIENSIFKWINLIDYTITADAPLSISSNNITISQADAYTDGFLSKEDYATFAAAAALKRPLKIWQYQDFTAPVSTSLTLSAFQNGSGLNFNEDYIVADTAVIVLTTDNSKVPTTTTSIPGRWLPTNRVQVSSHIGDTIILDQTPAISLACRIWFLCSVPADIALPTNYIEAPKFITDASLFTLDDIYVNQEGAETIYGIKTFNNDIITNEDIGVRRTPTTYPLEVDGYIWAVSGGVRFPDLTYQNTAFNGLAAVRTTAPITGDGTASSPVNIQSASATQSGAITTSAQSIAGPKTLTSILTVSANGAAAAPAISVGTDPDTGLYWHSANNLSIATAGTEAARFTQDGYIYAPNGGFRFPDNNTLSVLTASGQVQGTYPTLNVIGIRETSGPTNLTVGALQANQLIARGPANNLISGPQFTGPDYGLNIFDDFFAATTTGLLGWSAGTSGTNAATAQNSVGTIITANHPGLFSINPGSTNVGRATLALQLAGVLFGGGQVIFETMVWLDTLSTVAEEIVLRIGFNDQSAGANLDAQDGTYFVYDRAVSGVNWQARTVSASIITTTDTGIPVQALTFIKLRITVNALGTSVNFSVNGAAGTAITTNIPTGASRLTGVLLRTDKTVSAGGNLNLTYFDYVWVNISFTTAR